MFILNIFRMIEVAEKGGGEEMSRGFAGERNVRGSFCRVSAPVNRLQ